MNLQMPLDESQRALIRPVSKAIFNGRYALEVLAVMAQEQRFYLSQVAAQAGCEPSYLGEFMKRLQGAGLIERLVSDPGQARVYYEKRPSPLWRFSLELANDLLGDAKPAEIMMLRNA